MGKTSKKGKIIKSCERIGKHHVISPKEFNYSGEIILHDNGRLIPFIRDGDVFYSNLLSKHNKMLEVKERYYDEDHPSCSYENIVKCLGSKLYGPDLYMEKNISANKIIINPIQEKFMHRISVLFHKMSSPKENTKKYLDELHKKVFFNNRNQRELHLISDEKALKNLKDKKYTQLKKLQYRKYKSLEYIRKRYNDKNDIKYLLPIDYDVYDVTHYYSKTYLLVIKDVGQDKRYKEKVYTNPTSIGIKRWVLLELAKLNKVDLLTSIDDSQRLSDIQTITICNKYKKLDLTSNVLETFLLYQEDVYQTIKNIPGNKVAFFGIPSGGGASRIVSDPMEPKLSRAITDTWSIWKIYSMIPSMLDNVTYRPDLGYQAEDIVFAEDVAQDNLKVMKSLAFRAIYKRPPIICTNNENIDNYEKGEKRSIIPYLNLLDDNYFRIESIDEFLSKENKKYIKREPANNLCLNTFVKYPDFVLMTRKSDLPAFQLQEQGGKWIDLLFPKVTIRSSRNIETLIKTYKIINKCETFNTTAPYAIRWIIIYYIHSLRMKLQRDPVYEKDINELKSVIRLYQSYLPLGFHLHNFDFIIVIDEIVNKYKHNVIPLFKKYKYGDSEEIKHKRHVLNEIKNKIKTASQSKKYDLQISEKQLEGSLKTYIEAQENRNELCEKHKSHLFDMIDNKNISIDSSESDVSFEEYSEPSEEYSEQSLSEAHSESSYEEYSENKKWNKGDAAEVKMTQDDYYDTYHPVIIKSYNPKTNLYKVEFLAFKNKEAEIAEDKLQNVKIGHAYEPGHYQPGDPIQFLWKDRQNRYRQVLDGDITKMGVWVDGVVIKDYPNQPGIKIQSGTRHPKIKTITRKFTKKP